MRTILFLIIGLALAVGGYLLAPRLLDPASTKTIAAAVPTIITFEPGMDIQAEVDKLVEGGTATIVIPQGEDVQKRTTEALLAITEGGTVEFGEGTYELTNQLQLRQPNVTIRGKGRDKTILNFAKQEAGTGGEGLLVKADGFTIEDITLEETKGDAIKVTESDRVVFRRTATVWHNEGNEKNGAYGIYPVLCKNVLIEECLAVGASDAGIYVGQSENIIVRNSKAEKNVAGIEIENSKNADVYGNEATDNSGGILVFDLPDLPAGNGGGHRVYDNNIHANNHVNFAPKGNIVGNVPPGTGLMIMGTDDVEVFDNVIADNKTSSVSIISFTFTGRPVKDKAKYDPIPEGISIHDNKISGGGQNPAGFVAPLAVMVGKPFPDILYDGIVNPDAMKDGTLPPEKRIVIENNGDATFVNLRFDLLEKDPDSLMKDLPAAMAHAKKFERDLGTMAGKLASREPVKLEGIDMK